MLPRPDDTLRPVLAAGQDAVGERGQQARSQRRGLAAARRPDKRQQRRADELGDELRHEPFPTEEVRSIADVERRQPLVRADDRGCDRAPDEPRSRPSCSSTTSPVSSNSSARSSLRPTDARSATSPTRRDASRQAHWPASSWTRPGMPPLDSRSCPPAPEPQPGHSRNARRWLGPTLPSSGPRTTAGPAPSRVSASASRRLRAPAPARRRAPVAGPRARRTRDRPGGPHHRRRPTWAASRSWPRRARGVRGLRHPSRPCTARSHRWHAPRRPARLRGDSCRRRACR